MMKERQLELGTRWDAVRAKGHVLGWHDAGSPFVANLAGRCGMEWYASRSQDRVEEFMAYDASGLFGRLAGFGRIKCHHLIEILEAASANMDVSAAATRAGLALTYAEVLHLWGVPPEYPLHLLPLSVRLLNFCEHQQITTLRMLLELWATIGRAGLLAHENIGRRTADELQGLANSISAADAAAVRQWLPLNEAETGLCMRRALALSFGILSNDVLTILTRRIVDKLKLEEVGIEHRITRDRVRQLEAKYLRDIREILAWFATEHAVMLEAWTEGRDWQSFLHPQASPEATTLILEGIETCFADTPQGVARRLSAEAEMHGWLDALTQHPDLHLGGVDLQVFLASTVPVSKQLDFITDLTNWRGLLIDHASGLVKPADPSVRDTVCAILAQEEESIPLTWLARRVQGIEGCEEGDADFILRNRYRWSSGGMLKLGNVLWDQ